MLSSSGLDFEDTPRLRLVVKAETVSSTSFMAINLILQDVNDNLPRFQLQNYVAYMREAQGYEMPIIQVYKYRNWTVSNHPSIVFRLNWTVNNTNSSRVLVYCIFAKIRNKSLHPFHFHFLSPLHLVPGGGWGCGPGPKWSGDLLNPVIRHEWPVQDRPNDREHHHSSHHGPWDLYPDQVRTDLRLNKTHQEPFNVHVLWMDIYFAHNNCLSHCVAEYRKGPLHEGKYV